MLTIKLQWESYRKAVLPFDAPPVQVIECRRAFYAGITAMNQIFARIGEPDISENDGMIWMRTIQEELRLFAATIGTSKEGEY